MTLTSKRKCYSFCAKREIDCVPALEDSLKIYVRQPEKYHFVEEIVASERIINSSINIFSPELVEKFANHHLLLVFCDNSLSGVVHFSDYNRSVVSIYLYKIFLAYEKALRAVLHKHGYKNENMIEYFREMSTKLEGRERNFYERKIKDYSKKSGDLKQLLPFQSFYLKDLIGLAEYNSILFVDNRVNDLRNMVMHAHEFVSMEDPTSANLIYNFETFKRFSSLATILHNDYRRVANHLAFLNPDTI